MDGRGLAPAARGPARAAGLAAALAVAAMPLSGPRPAVAEQAAAQPTAAAAPVSVGWHDGQVSLRDVCGVHGLDLQGEYLTGHCCGLTPVSTRPYKPHNRKARAGRMDWPDVIYPSTLSRDPWAADMERTLLI